MKATNRNRAVTVGIFIFLGLVIFIAGILILGGQQRTFEKKIKLKAIFDNVGGLQKGNNVWFSGVKIGTVDDIKFYGNSQIEVIMKVEKDVQKYIRRNAKARISSEGFIGNKIVDIYGGTPNRPIVENGDVLGVEEALSTDEIMATLQQNNLNLLEITKDFKEIADKLSAGQGSVGKLLTDETLANSLEATATTLRQASANAQRLTENIAGYSAKLQTKGSFANDLVSDTIIFSRLQATSSQLDQVSRTATDVVNNLKAASSNLNSSNTPLGALLTDQETANNLKRTLQNLQAGTEKLDENMEALQHNFLLRGFFRKKAKQEAKQSTSSPATKSTSIQNQKTGLDSSQ
jgi:phospholipid/cholesterol/gamma-HCH transport system substrate-binding protein